MRNKVSDNSFTFYESYDSNGQLQSVIKYTIPNEETSGYFFIPKWLIALAVLFYVFVLTCLFAAIFVVYLAPRPGLYQESCAGRSCVKNFNLVCLNNTCTCPNGYVYIDKCTLKKTYSEQCNSNNYCQVKKNLVCLNGVCSCNSKQYWTGNTCPNLGYYASSCNSNSNCDDSIKLVCDTTRGKCGCLSTR